MRDMRIRELRALAGIAAPLAVTQISQLAMNLSATFMLGRVDARALAAGGLCAIIIQALTVVSQGMIAGVQPVLASARGARESGWGDPVAEARAFAGAVAVALACTAVAMVLLVNLPLLMTAFRIETAVVDDANLYIKGAVWALPAILWMAPMRFYLSVVGRAWVIMVATAVGAVLYLGLLYMFLFGASGLPPLGIVGAGTAFSIAWWAIAIGVTAYVVLSGHVPSGVLRLTWRQYLSGMRDVCAIGWPIALIYAAELGLTIVTTLLISSFGTTAILANQIAYTLNSITFNPIVALAQAATVRVAYHVGARQRDLAQMTGNLALGVAAAIMAVFGTAILASSGWIVTLFIEASNPDIEAVRALTRQLLLVLCAFLIFDGLQSVGNGALRGLKDTRTPMLMGLFGYWLIGLPIAVILGFPLGLGPVGIWLGILSGITSVACLLVRRWRRRMAMQPVAVFA
jgi:MATE family multidrug resistance protein